MAQVSIPNEYHKLNEHTAIRRIWVIYRILWRNESLMTYDVSRLIFRHLFGSRNKPSTFTVYRSILLLCQLYAYIIKVSCHMLHDWNLKHMHSMIKPNQPVMEHLGFPSPSCQGSFKAENRENTSKPNKQHVGCWVGNHHDSYPGWFQERGKPQILLIMKLWIKPLVELRCPRRQTKNPLDSISRTIVSWSRSIWA